MKKKITLIVLGSLLAVVALLAIVLYLRGPFVGFAGSRTADGSRAVSDGGVKIAGWNGEVDAAEKRAGMSIKDAKLSQEGDSSTPPRAPPQPTGWTAQTPPGTTR